MKDCLPPWRLLLTAIGVTVLSYYPVGYHHAVLNVAHETFQKLINESYTQRYGGDQVPSESTLSTIWSVTVSSWQIGALLGSLNAFWAVDRFGRKCTLMLIAGAFQLVGSFFMILSPSYGYFELLIVGRLLSGISTGLVCPSLRVFLSECSPDKYRGTLNSLAGFVMAVGIVSAMGAGLPEAWGSGSTGHAQLLLGVCLPLAIVQMASYPLFPATPKFLYLSRKLTNEAEASIVFYHGPDADVAGVFKELERERRLASEELAFLQALRLKTVRFPLILAMVSGIVYSSVGVDVVDAYSTEMFIELGMPAWESKLASMLFNVAGIAGAILSIFIVDRLGRRTLLLGTLITCFLCNIALIFVGALGRYGFGAGSSAGMEFGATAAAFIGVMTFAYALGPGAVLESLFAEISPHKVRSVAGSISEVAFWSTNSFYVLVFHPATVSVGTFAVLIYTIPLLACTIYFAFYLPETGQKSVADVAEQMLALCQKRKRIRAKSENSVSSAATTTTICSIGGQFMEPSHGEEEENRHLLTVASRVHKSGTDGMAPMFV